MNDRFKFRIYDLEQKHYLRVIQDETTGAEGFAAFYGKYNNICKPMSFFLCHDIDRWVIEQCTGLKDKNGNLIYEGDIIQNSDKDQYVVEWCIDGYWYIRQTDDEKFGCALASIKTLYDGWEIIGNIHEQAEQKDVK